MREVTLSGTETPHSVTSWCYARSIARAAMSGAKIPPILIWGKPGNCVLLAGTHRAAANTILEAIGREDCMIDYAVYDEESASPDMIEAVNDSRFDIIDDLWGDRDAGYGCE